MVVVDERDDGHLLALGPLGLLADEPVANQVADRLTARGVALGRDALIEGVEQGALQRNAHAGQVRHDASRFHGRLRRSDRMRASSCTGSGWSSTRKSR